MSFNPGRPIASVAIFWLFVGFCVAAFALGWSLDHAPIDPAARDDLSDLHISLGLTAGLLLLADIIVGAAHYIYRGGGGEPGPGRELAGFWIRKLVYLAFLVMVGAAVLSAAYRGEPLYFWGYPLPAWDLGKRALAEPVEMRISTPHIFSPPASWATRSSRSSTSSFPARKQGWSSCLLRRPASSRRGSRAASAFLAARLSGSSFFSA